MKERLYYYKHNKDHLSEHVEKLQAYGVCATEYCRRGSRTLGDRIELFPRSTPP